MLVVLQMKSQALIELYAIIIISVLILGIFFFAFNKSFRNIAIDYIKNHVFFLTIFLSFYILYLVTRIFLTKSLFVSLFKEDGVFEYLTSIFFIVASVFFVLCLTKKMSMYLKTYIISLALVCFLVGMEEISWGQRIFNIETPESLKEINYQDELTVHNLVSPTYHPIIYLIISLLCLVFFSFTNNKKYDFLFWVHKDYLPSKKFLVIAFLLPFISWYNMEHFEVILSFLFLVYSFQLFNKKRQKVLL